MKKKFHFLFALLLVMVTFTGNAQNRDLNGDGVVDLSDVTDLIDYILNPPLTQTYTVNGVSFDMITMQGGTFTMGTTEDQSTYKIKGTVLLVCGRMGCFIYLAIGNQKNRPFAIKTRLIDKFSES